MDEAINALLSARAEVDKAIAGYRDKLAILQVRRDALQQAVDALRAPDEDVRQLIKDAPSAPPGTTAENRSPRVYVFDEEAVERLVLNILQGHKRPVDFATIDRELGDVRHSEAGLRRILKTSPLIAITGERSSMRFSLK